MLATKMAKNVTNILMLSSTHFVSNIDVTELKSLSWKTKMRGPFLTMNFERNLTNWLYVLMLLQMVVFSFPLEYIFLKNKNSRR